jgi:hypothetical protein
MDEKSNVGNQEEMAHKAVCHQPSDLAAFSDCNTCRDILWVFTNPDESTNVNLGSFVNADPSTCSGHMPLVESFRDHCRKQMEREDDEEFNLSDMGLIVFSKGDSPMLTQSLSKLGNMLAPLAC